VAERVFVTREGQPSRSRLPSLDGVRAVCIALVIGAHAEKTVGFPDRWRTAASYLVNGPMGVTVFFVLSGFLITFLLVREELARGEISLRAFYARRALRILPVYAAYVAALAAISQMTAVDFSACEWTTTLTFTKNFACGQWVDGHLWSLSVEEQFYLFWPMAVACLTRRRRIWIAASCVLVAPIARVVFFVNGWYDLEMYSLMTNVDALMIGAVVGAALANGAVPLDAVLRYRPAIVRCAAAALIWTLMVLDHFITGATAVVAFSGTVTALLAAYLIASYASIPGGPVFALLNWRPVRYVGVLSYSLYIWQQPFLSAANPYGFSSIPGALTFPSNTIAAFTVAAVSYHALEKPLLSLRTGLRPRESERSRRAEGAKLTCQPAEPERI
jgi:peptidoglycan/LPS O-acetylase OafA/YrhL